MTGLEEYARRVAAEAPELTADTKTAIRTVVAAHRATTSKTRHHN